MLAVLVNALGKQQLLFSVTIENQETILLTRNKVMRLSSQSECQNQTVNLFGILMTQADYGQTRELTRESFIRQPLKHGSQDGGRWRSEAQRVY